MYLLAMLLTAQAPADATAWKLVMSDPQVGMTVIDYPTEQRCRRGQAAIEREAQRQQSEGARRAPLSGGVVIGTPRLASGMCIPG